MEVQVGRARGREQELSSIREQLVNLLRSKMSDIGSPGMSITHHFLLTVTCLGSEKMLESWLSGVSVCKEVAAEKQISSKTKSPGNVHYIIFYQPVFLFVKRLHISLRTKEMTFISSYVNSDQPPGRSFWPPPGSCPSLPLSP